MPYKKNATQISTNTCRTRRKIIQINVGGIKYPTHELAYELTYCSSPETYIYKFTMGRRIGMDGCAGYPRATAALME